MGQFLGASKPSIIMNCNCICTVFPPLIASAYIQYTYITKSSVKAFLMQGISPQPSEKEPYGPLKGWIVKR